MLIKVTKRDGRVEDFNSQKIVDAICKAMIKTTKGVDLALAKEIADGIANVNDSLTVEEIQDIVEESLMETKRKDVAREYITYRAFRTRERNKNSELKKKVRAVVKSENVQNSNANVDEWSFGGKKFESAAVVHKDIAMDMLSDDVRKAFENWYIYIHDFDSYDIAMHNCLFCDLGRLLKFGFKTRNGDVRGANSFSTACQLTAVIFQCQSQVQFGGVGTMHLDYDLAPYVAKSFKKHFADALVDLYDETEEEAKEHSEKAHLKMSLSNDKERACYKVALRHLEKEGQQAAQGLYHNLNTLESRPGNQLPFSSINFGLDTSPEGRKVTEWILKASLDGIGKNHRTSIFPIGIFQHKKGINSDPGDPNYDLKILAMESLSKRIYPNICNCDWSMNEYDPSNPDTAMATMGCRTLIGKDRHGFGYSKVGRGNIAPTTIILPKLGIEYGICLGKRTEPDLEGFWKAFDEVLKVTEQSLVERYALIANQLATAAPFMYGNNTMRGYNGEKTVREAMKHGTLAFGFTGVAEMCQALFGENHIHSQKVYDFALSVVKHIYDYATEASERNDLNFSCYASPAEALVGKVAKAMRKEYGIIPNVTDRDYVTNSYHVPVWEKVSIFEKIDLEAPFSKYCTGGNIMYIELDAEIMQNQKAIESIINYAMEKDVPYLAFNFPIDTCLDCGYTGEFNDCCVVCGSKNIEQLRRVTGYLTTDYHNFNAGKIAEVKDRIKHNRYSRFNVN